MNKKKEEENQYFELSIFAARVCELLSIGWMEDFRILVTWRVVNK